MYSCGQCPKLHANVQAIPRAIGDTDSHTVGCSEPGTNGCVDKAADSLAHVYADTGHDRPDISCSYGLYSYGTTDRHLM